MLAKEKTYSLKYKRKGNLLLLLFKGYWPARLERFCNQKRTNFCFSRLALCFYYSRVLGCELSSSLDNRKSTWGRKLVSWKSAKQRRVYEALALLLFVYNMDTCSIKMKTKILYQFSYKPMEKSFIYYTYNFNPYRHLLLIKILI